MNVLTKYKPNKEPVEFEEPAEDYTEIENNRLDLQFERLKSTKSKNNKNTVSIRNTLSENLFIRTKDTKEDVDSTENMLKKMNIMGIGQGLMIRKLYPNVEEEGPVKKVKEKRKSGGLGLTSLIIPGAILLSTQIPKLSKKIPKILSSLNPIKKTEPEIKKEEIFGLTPKDKAAIRKSKINNEKASDTLDRIIRLTSNGYASSLGALIFGFTYFKHSGIYKMIVKNMKEYSEGVLEAFNSIVKITFAWFKEQIEWVKDKASDVATSVKNTRDRALKYLDSLINADEAEGTNIKKTGITKSILQALRSMTVTFFGSGLPKDNVNKKQSELVETGNIKSKARKSDGVASDTSNEDTAIEGGSDFNFTGGNIQIDGAIVTKGIVSKVAIYKAFIESGFGGGQAAALTAEVGRENSYNAKVLFGNHKDPAKGHNIGMISWQGSRKADLIRRLKTGGVLRSGNPVLMDQNYKSLLIMAQYVMHEMKNGWSGASKEKLALVRQFLAKPNISYMEAAPLLGKGYISWAYGQSTIKDPDRPGKRKAFNWKAHQNRAAGYHKQLGKELAGKGDGGIEPSDESEVWPALNNQKIRNVSDKLDNALELDKDGINLRLVNNKEKRRSLRLPPEEDNSFVQNDSTNEINNIIHRAPNPSLTQKKNGNVDSKPPNFNTGDGSKNNKSIFEIMMHADLTGNMLT